jgi:hypothetical protein
MKKRKKKPRNPHAISANQRKSGVIPSKKRKKRNGKNKQAEFMKEADDAKDDR